MADANVILFNPTSADVTVNSQTAVAGKATRLVIDNTTDDLYGFVAAGCWAGPTLDERDEFDQEAEATGFYIQRNAEDLGRLEAPA